MSIAINSTLKVYLLCCFVSLGGFMYGYDSGMISTVLVMKRFQSSYSFESNTIAAYTIVPVTSAASCVASFCSGFIADSLGRRSLFFIASIIHEIGCVIEIASGSRASFFVGRIITGISIGIYSMAVPLYQSEIAEPENRGKLINCYQTFVTLGFFISFWIGYGTFHSSSDLSFQIPIGLQLLPGLILLIGTYFIPESPRWLIYKDRKPEAFKILCRLRGTSDVLMEFTGIVQDVRFDRLAYPKPFMSLLRSSNDNNRKRTLLGMGIHTFTQFTGINAILFYLPHILQSIGMKEVRSALIGNGCAGAVNFLATLVVFFYIDRWNRKFILIWGAIAMSICMFIISIVSGLFKHQLGMYSVLDGLAFNHGENQNTTVSIVIMCLLCIFICFFALSWGPVGWIYPAEIYPQMIRANAMGVTTSSSYLFSLVISFIAPIMFQNIGWATYLFFGLMCLLMSLVVHVFYPETKGRSLEEIQLIFGGALIDNSPDAHHPETAAEALIHLEQIQHRQKRFTGQWDQGDFIISSPENVSRTLNHRIRVEKEIE